MEFPRLPIKNHNKKIWPTLEVASDNRIAALFLEAVSVNPESAWAFVSKVYSHSLDLEALHDVLYGSWEGRLYKHVVNVQYTTPPPNCLTRSVLVEDMERKQWLLHLRMIKEPDQYGLWKIIGVDKEECVRNYADKL